MELAYTNYTDRKLFSLLNTNKKEIKKLEIELTSISKKIKNKQKKEEAIKLALAKKLEILSSDTVEAITEAKEMKKNPEQYQGYKSLDDLKIALES